MSAPATEMPAGAFPPTHWSVVFTAGHGGSTDAADALADLCRTYWYPLYAFARREGHPPEEAQDLTQGFFEHLIETHLVGAADEAPGEVPHLSAPLFPAPQRLRIRPGQAAEARWRLAVGLA